MNHLINKRPGGVKPTKDQLNFELNLRQRRNETKFHAKKAFVFPTAKQAKPIVIDKGTFSGSLPTLKGMKETFDPEAFKTLKASDSKYLD